MTRTGVPSLPRAIRTALYAIAALSVMAPAAGENVVIADFTLPDPMSMKTMNDPVMGGTSHSTASLHPGEGLVWSGEVNIVSFLRSPGFCILESAGTGKLGPLGNTDGISFEVKGTEKMLKPMGAQISTGAMSKSWGVEVTFSAPLEERARSDGTVELYAPWSDFKAKFRGEDVPDAPLLDAEQLNRAYRVGMSTYQSHKAGPFTVELIKIVASLRGVSVS
eukprot:CAMPEP_0113563394 /NCGR_PEP_ID=MMETSP0015_2-20120614/21050_1 /TAXON_ID=2838 /ORGANISM="Odontella" /LENGTH=220 /DNA_ID=CAMNT_0000465381 /DNA_START=18 /DNA_END=680 /DNA_ORIENTATION=- /assembly_acc=CAM_ASM_000160